MDANNRMKVLIALATLYIAWSSTYLAIRFSLESFPPFFTAGSRYMLVGLVMFLSMRWRGAPPPTRAQWKGSTIVGTFLLLGGTGGVVYAMQWVGVRHCRARDRDHAALDRAVCGHLGPVAGAA